MSEQCSICRGWVSTDDPHPPPAGSRSQSNSCQLCQMCLICRGLFWKRLQGSVSPLMDRCCRIKYIVFGRISDRVRGFSESLYPHICFKPIVTQCLNDEFAGMCLMPTMGLTSNSVTHVKKLHLVTWRMCLVSFH